MGENEQVRFYKEHNIAPVINAQNKEFLEKRRKLYRQLGIPILCIEGKDIIEFGASCGENSLPLVVGFGNAEKRAHHIDIVEPNEVGRNVIKEMFKKNGVTTDQYTLHCDTLESFLPQRKYDIIIAEQFLQHCTNWKECLSILKNCAKENSIIIITCADGIGLYVEIMKRFVGRCVVRELETFDAKVSCLTKMFAGFLNTLKGMNKTHRTYIADMFFDDFLLNGAQMNMADAIEFFRKDFDVFGASQNIFTDYSWYKDLNYDYITDYKKQYLQKRHMFLFAGEMEETIRSVEDNEMLESAITKAIEYEADCERNGDLLDVDEWEEVIEKVNAAFQNNRLICFNREFLELLKKIDQKETIQLSDFPIFANSFGKSSQYISFGMRDSQ